MALAPLAPTTPTLFAGRALRIEASATTTVVVLEGGRRLAIAGAPDPVGARRCGRALNHITSVRIEGSASRASARVRGVGNRLPVDLAVPVATALALVDAGVPAFVRLVADDLDPVGPPVGEARS